jgi:hypothetical protein
VSREFRLLDHEEGSAYRAPSIKLKNPVLYTKKCLTFPSYPNRPSESVAVMASFDIRARWTVLSPRTISEKCDIVAARL